MKTMSQVIALGLLIVLASTLVAQTNSAEDEGVKAFAARNWPRAIEVYSAKTKQDPKDGMSWYMLGRALEESGKNKDALPALQRALELKARPMFAQVHIAAVYAAMSDRKHALATLEKLASDGLDAPRLITEEPKFASLREEPRFKKVVQAVEMAGQPCRNPNNPEYRQFDFWVGDWDVFDRAGNKVGESSVKLILKDCVVYENWTSALGGEGKSFNKYNPWSRQWEQYWVDEGVDRMFFTGHRNGDEMQFEAEANMPDGKPVHRKLTFYKLADGTVRQFSQGTMDGGKTYSTEYDFVYKRKAEQARAKQ